MTVIGWLASTLGVVVSVVALFVVFLLFALRSRRPSLLRPIRLLNRRLWNRLVMRSAGRPGASASVIHHVGRRSGSRYRTPIAVLDADDEFVVVLPYGTEPDWLKNVVAARSAVLVTEGTTHRVGGPRVVPTRECPGLFTPGQARLNRLFGIDQVLRLTKLAEIPSP